MRRMRPIPPWAEEILKEFTRPPLFLEHMHNQQTKVIPDNQQRDAKDVEPTRTCRDGTTHPSRSRETVQRQTAYDATQSPGREPTESHPHNKPSDAPSRRIRQANWSQVTAEPGQDTWQSSFRDVGIPPNLAKAYGWHVQSAQAVNGAARVRTRGGGDYGLKRTDISDERVAFLRKAFRHLEEQGFHEYAPFVPTKEGAYTVSRKDNTYYATRWVIGNPLNLSSVGQVSNAATTLARFHELSRGFEGTEYHPPMAFDIAGLTRRRLEDLKSLLARAEAVQDPDAFDEALVRLSANLRKDGEKSLRILEDPACAQFLNKDESLPGLCHLDVIPGNLIYTPEKTVHLIDLDLSTYAPRVLDIGHLLRRALQVTDWRSDMAYNVFLAFNDVRSIQAEEYLLVQGLLTFPYRAWRVAHARYRIGRDTAQLQELRHYAQQEDRRQAFLEEYGKQLQLRVD